MWCIYCEDGTLVSDRVEDTIAAGQGEELQLAADAEEIVDVRVPKCYVLQSEPGEPFKCSRT